MSTPSSQPPHDSAANLLSKFSDVRPRPAAWLWGNWLPLGKLAILDGDPGLGKSTLLFDLAARVSSSGVMPDGSAGVSGNVIILNAEDDPAETIQPRLVAAGANPERVFHLGEIDTGNRRRQVQIPDDAPLLARLIAQQDARLLIIDPLLAFLAGADANCDQHIRRVLQQISSLAQQHGCAVICVRHLNKGASPKAVYRGSGSIGMIGHARTGLLVAQDPNDDEQRILAVSKCNMGGEAGQPALRAGRSRRGQPDRLARDGAASGQRPRRTSAKRGPAPAPAGGARLPGFHPPYAGQLYLDADR